MKMSSNSCMCVRLSQRSKERLNSKRRRSNLKRVCTTSTWSSGMLILKSLRRSSKGSLETLARSVAQNSSLRPVSGSSALWSGSRQEWPRKTRISSCVTSDCLLTSASLRNRGRRRWRRSGTNESLRGRSDPRTSLTTRTSSRLSLR